MSEANGVKEVCFLKKLEKRATSSNSREFDISDIFQSARSRLGFSPSDFLFYEASGRFIKNKE